jgi:excisionase family DNA binding protein
MSFTTKTDTAPILLRDHEAAKIANISRQKMYMLMRAGDVPGVVRIGRCIRIHRGALMRWLNEQAGENEVA